MATGVDGTRGVRRTLRDLLTVTAAATAAALGVAVIVTPAVSYLDGSLEGSLSGIASEVPASLSAPVKRLLAPGDITVRVRPGRPASSIALADSAVSPTGLVTGRPTQGRAAGPLGTAGPGAGPGVAGPMARAVPAPEVGPPSEPAGVVPPAPPAPPAAPPGPPVEAIAASVPDDREDPGATTKQRRRTSKPLRVQASPIVFSISGTQSEPDPKASQRHDSGAGLTVASSSGDDSGRAKGGDEPNKKDHPDQSRGQHDEAKKRNPKPERR